MFSWCERFKAQPTNALPSTKCFSVPPSSVPTTAEHRFVVWTVQDYRTLGRSRKLGGAAEHLIGGSEKTHVSVELSALALILESARNWKAQYIEKKNLVIVDFYQDRRTPKRGTTMINDEEDWRVTNVALKKFRLNLSDVRTF